MKQLAHPPITTEPPRIHLVLADLYHLFTRPKVGHVAKKLVFYSVALGQVDRQAWLTIERALEKEVEKLGAEEDPDKAGDEVLHRDHLLV